MGIPETAQAYLCSSQLVSLPLADSSHSYMIVHPIHRSIWDYSFVQRLAGSSIASIEMFLQRESEPALSLSKVGYGWVSVGTRVLTEPTDDNSFPWQQLFSGTVREWSKQLIPLRAASSLFHTNL